jgi:hypothetical protein
MNANVEKILNEFESTRGFGAIEIIYNNGVVVTIHIKKTLKMTSNEPNSPREYRGQNGQHENR